MVRVQIKACPNLSILFDAGDPALIAAFFKSRPFERLTWLSDFAPAQGGILNNEAACSMLAKENKMQLGPLEAEAARVITMAGSRGQFALEGLARTKLSTGRMRELIGQRDEVARSLWAYVNESNLFDATENSLHMRLYRRYDRHYQTFRAEPNTSRAAEVEEDMIKAFLAFLKEQLNRGAGYHLERFELPEEADQPAAVMYLLHHPRPATSARDMDDEGNSTRIYLRPPGEAMIVYTPSTGMVHVRADTRALRHQISEGFIETVLGQQPSHQPVDFQAYDISKFHSNFELDSPAMDDVEIVSTKVIRVDVSVGDLASRLSISTSMHGDLGKLVVNQPGLSRILERAIAVRFLEIAVRYRPKDQDEMRTLDIALSDRNTCSLFSLEDPFERLLGHRLLKHWEILREGRVPSETDSMQALPALLELWDIGRETVFGAWLYERRIDPALLIDVGFLVPAGADVDGDLIDDEDSVGAVVAKVVSRLDGPGLNSFPGHEAPAGALERYRVYRVRKNWVAQHLYDSVAALFGKSAPLALDANLIALGTLPIGGKDVPVYLARGLDDEKTRAAVDTKLRERQGGGVGLVLQAGKAFGSSLAGNVLTRLADHLDGSLPDVSLNLEKLRMIFVSNHVLAAGGRVVEFVQVNESFGTLYVPGKGSVDIPGSNRVRVIRQLVDAHNTGTSPLSSDVLRKEIADQSLSNIFGQPLWDKLKAGFVRSPRRPLWEIAV